MNLKMARIMEERKTRWNFKMKINQFSPYFGDEEYKKIKECFDSNWITEGPLCAEFSDKLLKLTGAKYGVFAPNGTLALYLALKAAGIKPGDEVLVSNFTFIASANAIEMIGATPVFVDINMDLHINLEHAEQLITKKTAGIMPIHIYGTACDMESVMKFAKRHNLKVVEDAAQAIGVHWNGKHCGTFGDVGTFSFFADKTITTGEGGFVVTNDEKIYENLLYIRNQGRINRGSFLHPEIGYNFRITDLQAAVGLAQISKLSEIIQKKINIYNLYTDKLKNKDFCFLKPNEKSGFVPFRVALFYKHNVENLMNYLTDNGIETRTFFYPLHNQPCFASKGWTRSEYKSSIYAYDHGLCMPSYVSLSEEQIDYICERLNNYVV